jgi:hypothetical protein
VVLQKDNLPFLKKNSPIGARDLEIYTFLKENDVPTYFSGCLTLTLKKRGLQKDSTICCVDTSPDVTAYVKRISPCRVVELHNSEIPPNIPYEEKMKIAQKTLDAYEQADLVVSSRLHAVLPSLALETPTILIHNKNKDSSRYLGLKDLVRNCDEQELLNGLFDDKISNPVPNKPYYKTMARNLENIVNAYMRDSPLPSPAYTSISEENMKTILEAKEENEKEMRMNISRLLNSSGKISSMLRKLRI